MSWLLRWLLAFIPWWVTSERKLKSTTLEWTSTKKTNTFLSEWMNIIYWCMSWKLAKRYSDDVSSSGFPSGASVCATGAIWHSYSTQNIESAQKHANKIWPLTAGAQSCIIIMTERDTEGIMLNWLRVFFWTQKSDEIMRGYDVQQTAVPCRHIIGVRFVKEGSLSRPTSAHKRDGTEHQVIVAIGLSC